MATASAFDELKWCQRGGGTHPRLPRSEFGLGEHGTAPLEPAASRPQHVVGVGEEARPCDTPQSSKRGERARRRIFARLQIAVSAAALSPCGDVQRRVIFTTR